MSALIRDAVDIVYGAQRPAEDDIVAMRRAFGRGQVSTGTGSSASTAYGPDGAFSRARDRPGRHVGPDRLPPRRRRRGGAAGDRTGSRRPARQRDHPAGGAGRNADWGGGPTRQLLSTLHWHAVDAAEAAGALGRTWLPSHHTIDGADLAIAATVIRLGARLFTLNVRHFPMSRTSGAPVLTGARTDVRAAGPGRTTTGARRRTGLDQGPDVAERFFEVLVGVATLEGRVQ